MDRIVWSPQPTQELFMRCWQDEALYGGAAGGGKSDAVVMEGTRQVHIPYYKGLILRKTYVQLRELIDKSLNYYPQAFPGCKYNSSEHTWRFKSGAKIIFGDLQRTQDREKYQGQAFDYIAFDELTHFKREEYMYLLSRNRPNGPGTRCYMRATANPGGIGHGWVKDRFITAAPARQTVWDDVEIVFPDGHKEARKHSRIFIPSSVFDNKILMANDPNYIARLAAMPEAERNALLYGDWNSFSGQFFKSFRDDPQHYRDRRWTHVIDPFDIPSDWVIERSFDWGYNKPFSCAWTAVDYDGIGYRFLEYYGCTGTPNTGVQMIPDKVFKEIHRIEAEHPWLKGKRIIGTADPAIWNAEHGESIAEVAARHQVYFSPGDHERIPGWLQCQYRLAFDEDGIPMFYVFKTCRNFIRTIPTLVFDEKITEDLDTSAEDHIADEWRYWAMSRPIKPRPNHMDDGYLLTPQNVIFDIPRKDLAPRRLRHKMEVIKDGTTED